MNMKEYLWLWDNYINQKLLGPTPPKYQHSNPGTLLESFPFVVLIDVWE